MTIGTTRTFSHMLILIITRIAYWFALIGACLPWVASLCLLTWVGRVIVCFSSWPTVDSQHDILLRKILFHDPYYPTLFHIAEQADILTFYSLPIVSLAAIITYRHTPQYQRRWLLVTLLLGLVLLFTLVALFPAWWES